MTSASTLASDRPGRTHHHPALNESSFVFLFSEIVRYSLVNATDVSNIETKLSRMGNEVGSRLVELMHRDKPPLQQVREVSRCV